MNPKRRELCALLLASLFPIIAAAGQRPLKLGLFPYLSPQRLVTLYKPLATYLENQLHQPVKLGSTKDFHSFIDATQRGDFDIVLTAPHLAWLAQVNAGYRPIATYANTVSGLLVVKRSSEIHSASGLRGGVIAIPDPLAVVTLLMESYLAKQGLQRGKDYRFITRGTHNNAALAVTSGEAAAAVIGALPFGQLPDDLRMQLRIIGGTTSVRSLFFMLNPRFNLAMADMVQAALLRFNDTAAGQAFLQQTHYQRILPADSHSLASMSVYALQIQRMIRNKQP
ncbi:MAG TPA: ABC transporter substrate-binding protein [Betaproteobacteria bacterium]|nr:ABC transporter substrate-binding protein [Betaproteobacteria bacterium]